jgi:excisionase family DNA binding protein
MSEKDYFTSKEAAGLLDVAVSTIQLWTNNGLLRAWTTAGGHRRIARSSVEEMLGRKQLVSDDPPSEKPLSVLIVEDDASQLRLYEKQFRGWQLNAQLVTANDGYQGLIKIGHMLPDVIITDLMMPNIDGFQMIRALKELPELEQSLVIVVSGLTGDEISARGGLSEGVHVFTKPIPFENLETLLREKEQSVAMNIVQSSQ